MTAFAHNLRCEIANFQDVAQRLVPRPEDVPRLACVDLYGGTRALNGIGGGDHLLYIDFKRQFDLEHLICVAQAAGRDDIVGNLERCLQRAGVLLVDVSGHRVTDALLTAMVHQAFLIGAVYELALFGEVTRHLFENLNARLHQTLPTERFLSLLYAEISDDTAFRFLVAGQPSPVVFSSANQRFMEVDHDAYVAYPPLGLAPSLDVLERSTTTGPIPSAGPYRMNEWRIVGEGDIVLLYSDGILEHARADEDYCPSRLLGTLRDVQHASARNIFDAIMEDSLAFSSPADDMSLVVIKRSRSGSWGPAVSAR